MQKKHSVYLLTLIFLLVCATRLILSFQSPLPDYEAYDSLRHIQSIHDTGLPLYEDELSFGGKNRLFAPLYYYVLSFFSILFSPVLVVKIVPNILAATIVFPTYLLTRMISNNRSFSLIGAFLAGFIPANLLQGINDASSTTISIPLFFTAAYLFLKSRKSGKHLNYLLTVLIVMSLIDNLGLLLLLSFLVFIALLSIERITIRAKEIELVLFYLFFTGWITLIVYKQAFQIHGSSLIWQNIPLAQLSLEFSELTLIGAAAATGLVPLIAGVWGMYYSSTNTRKKSCYLMMSVLIISLVLLWFRLVPLGTGLIVLSVALSIMSGYALMIMYQAIKRTRTPVLSPLALVIILAFFLTTITPQYISYMPSTPDQELVSVLSHHQGMLENATIMAVPKEGAYLSYTTGARNVIDTDYLLTPRIEERYDDVISLYRSRFLLPVVETMTKYGATHLLISQNSQRAVSTQEFVFVDDDCFELLSSSGSTHLYRLACSLREGRP